MAKTFRGILTSLGHGIDRTRRAVLNSLFVVAVIAIITIIILPTDRPNVPQTAALVVKPIGTLVEQLSGDPGKRVLQKFTGQGGIQHPSETLLRDLVAAITAAKDDERVKVLLLDLNHLEKSGMTKLQDLAAAVDDFKSSGKTVIAAADSYSQSAYFVAAHADEVYLNPMGIVRIEGFGRYQLFFKEGIDRFGIDWNVFRVGTFKSAVEPFMRKNMSKAAREANLEWMGDLWRIYLKEAAAARGVATAKLRNYAENYDKQVRDADGDTAQAALSAGLIDTIANRDEVRARLIDLVGEDDAHSYHRICASAYLKAEGIDPGGADAEEGVVGVIVARGMILDGSQPPGTIGGDSTADLIRQARNDKGVKAVVLRVDSGGGSAFASEIIRRELAATRKAGKPIVVSMGSVAASGGYWVSMASDEVWAHPTTITGSIGVFGMRPTFQKPLSKYLGITMDGVGTTPFSGQAYQQYRALDPRTGKLIQTCVNQTYGQFIDLAAQARGMTREEIDTVAQGRVWSGEDAHRLGLVDQLGNLDDALAAAARLAGLGNDYSVRYIEKELGFKNKLAMNLLTGVAQMMGDDSVAVPTEATHQQLLGILARYTELLNTFNDPKGVYAYSFIETD